MSRPTASEGALLLRQRLEMGGSEIFLDGLTREQALALVRAAASFAPAAGPASAPTAGLASAPADSRPAAPKASRTGSGPARPAPDSAPFRATPPSTPREERASTGGASATAHAPEAAGGLPLLPDDYEQLRTLALGCTRCRLADGRTQVVFSDGPVDARLMVVGEAPGANEDETGLPFVGAAGKFLDLLLATVGLSREESVYIANVLKCRPPGNRNPTTDEIESCSPFLRKQIDLVRPEALLAVGSFSGKLLTGQENAALGKLRGEVHGYHGVPLVVTYHPAALLRNPRWTRLFWDDLQLLRDVMDAG